MTISRTRFVHTAAAASLFASVGILRRPASAAEFTFKLASDQVPTHPMTTASAAAAKRIAEASNGRIAISLFPTSVLGSDPQMLAQVRSGSIELMHVGNNVLGSVIPASALLNIPFAFRSPQEFMRAANGPLGAYVAAAAGKIGLRQFPAAVYGGTFQIENSLRPIASPADLKGMKIRVPPGPLDVATFKAFEASPAVISLGEVYTSLMTHLVDGIEAPLPTLQNFKFYEQTRYCAMTNHYALAYFLVANGEAWQRLPANLQELVERELGAAASEASSTFADQERTVTATLEREGVTFTHPAPEAFRAIVRTAGLYAQWRTQFDPAGWRELEKTTGALG